MDYSARLANIAIRTTQIKLIMRNKLFYLNITATHVNLYLLQDWLNKINLTNNKNKNKINSGNKDILI